MLSLLLVTFLNLKKKNSAGLLSKRRNGNQYKPGYYGYRTAVKMIGCARGLLESNWLQALPQAAL